MVSSRYVLYLDWTLDGYISILLLSYSTSSVASESVASESPVLFLLYPTMFLKKNHDMSLIIKHLSQKKHPKEHASRLGHVDVVSLLLSSGADPAIVREYVNMSICQYVIMWIWVIPLLVLLLSCSINNGVLESPSLLSPCSVITVPISLHELTILTIISVILHLCISTSLYLYISASLHLCISTSTNAGYDMTMIWLWCAGRQRWVNCSPLGWRE